MKTQELSAALMAFAPMAEERRSEELRGFASIFGSGKAETIGARLKKIPAEFGIPPSVKASLNAIEAGFIAAGAKKQAADVQAILSKLSGDFDGPINEYVYRITAAIVNTSGKSGGQKKAAIPLPADQPLARKIADELTSSVLDASTFSEILQRLADTKLVSTPTLHLIGNRFLRNSKLYKGRKPVIDDIKKRQAEELLDSSRRAAVKRAG